MLKKVRVDQKGDTDYLPGQFVDRFEFAKANDAVRDRRRRGRAVRGHHPRHHQGVAEHRLVPVGGLLPGDHQGAHRRRPRRKDRPPERAQGERDHRQADPRRHRPQALPADRDRALRAAARARSTTSGCSTRTRSPPSSGSPAARASTAATGRSSTPTSPRSRRSAPAPPTPASPRSSPSSRSPRPTSPRSSAPQAARAAREWTIERSARAGIHVEVARPPELERLCAALLPRCATATAAPRCVVRQMNARATTRRSLLAAAAGAAAGGLVRPRGALASLMPAPAPRVARSRSSARSARSAVGVSLPWRRRPDRASAGSGSPDARVELRFRVPEGARARGRPRARTGTRPKAVRPAAKRSATRCGPAARASCSCGPPAGSTACACTSST